MSRSLLLPLLVALASALALGCNRQLPTQPTDLTAQAADVADQAAAAAAPALGVEATSGNPEFDPGDFVRVINNRYFALRPGTTFIYVGREDGQPERVVTEVTHQKKSILGVKVVTVLDRVYLDGSLKEKTLDWYAQDEDGNVWYFGEDSKEYENGKVISTAGSWEAGKHGAKAGVIMLAHPRVGQSYRQEFARGVAEDKARVLSLDAKASVPYGTFRHCLKTEETTPLEPGAKEVKLHCPGVGFVKGDDVAGGTAHIALSRISP
jgi:hypothetical protein